MTRRQFSFEAWLVVAILAIATVQVIDRVLP